MTALLLQAPVAAHAARAAHPRAPTAALARPACRRASRAVAAAARASAAPPPAPPAALPPRRGAAAALATAAATLSLALLAAAPADAVRCPPAHHLPTHARSLSRAACAHHPNHQRTVAIAISNLSLAPCANPVAGGTPGTSTFKAKCFEISGTATNPDKEPVRNADVYGIVLGASFCASLALLARMLTWHRTRPPAACGADAENDPVLRSGRIGAIQTLPPVRKSTQTRLIRVSLA
jgi:hypothetical protein